MTAISADPVLEKRRLRPAGGNAVRTEAEAATAQAVARPPEPRLTPRRLFLLLGLLAALAIVLFRTQSLVREREHVLEQRRAQAVTLAQFAATYSARLYDESSRVADEVARRLRTSDLDDKALHNFLAKRAADATVDDYLVVLDAQGRVRATSESANPRAINYGRPGFADAWRSNAQQIVPALKSRLSGAVIYSLSRRLEGPDGRFAGVVGVNVRPEGIQPTAKRLPQDPLLTVWDRNGRFIAASFMDFDAAGRAIAPPKPAGLGVTGSAPADPADRLTIARPVQGWPLVASASYDKAGVLAGWRRDLAETIALVLLAFLGIGALVFVGVKTADREARARAELERSNALAATALQERDLLLKEVHHRVKNSLSMTASLLYLQERRFNDPVVREAFESTRRRLSSIGLAHEALYGGSSLADVDLSAYLTRLVGELGDAYGASARGVTVSAEIEALSLPAPQATPVGLIVAEAVTNAFKHAFAGRGATTITVRVRRQGLDEVEIEVRDDGDGFPDPDAADRVGGLGARLIESLSEQLRGQVTRRNDGGAVLRLVFPAPPQRSSARAAAE
jgi:two-component sensor histidine kinase